MDRLHKSQYLLSFYWFHYAYVLGRGGIQLLHQILKLQQKEIVRVILVRIPYLIFYS